MKLVVGLGNPGRAYEHTRHNAGFEAMDAIASLTSASITQKKFKALVDKVQIGKESVLLMKPQTYMNNSGEAVRAAMDFYRLSPQDLLVIYDDLDLPVGKLRLRQKGSAGGHNGIKMRAFRRWTGCWARSAKKMRRPIRNRSNRRQRPQCLHCSTPSRMR